MNLWQYWPVLFVLFLINFDVQAFIDWMQGLGT
jgi:hypothetical protein